MAVAQPVDGEPVDGDSSPSPQSFFSILHKLYSKILASLQVALDHLAEPETALQDLTTLHNQVHTRLQQPPHNTASSTSAQCRQVPRRSLRRWMSSGSSPRRWCCRQLTTSSSTR